MSAVTFCLLLYVPRYQLAQTPVSPHDAAGQQKQNPPFTLGNRYTAFFCTDDSKTAMFPVPTDWQHCGGYTSDPELEHPWPRRESVADLLAEGVWGL